MLNVCFNMQDSFHSLLHKADGKRSEWEYPFAVAGVNISYMLVQMLDLQSGEICSNTLSLGQFTSFALDFETLFFFSALCRATAYLFHFFCRKNGHKSQFSICSTT